MRQRIGILKRLGVFGNSVLIFGSLVVSSPNVLANINESQNAGRFECTSCHGGGLAPSLTAAQGFSVVDPDTSTAVTKYQPGKTYNLLIKFNNPAGAGPWRNAYVLHVAEISTGTALRAGSLIDSGGVGLVTDGGSTAPQTNSRIINSAVKNAVDNVQISWQAPTTGRVRFQLLRMETNNQNNQGGDQTSQNIETVTLRLESDTTTPTPEETPTETTSDTSGSVSTNGTGFNSDLAAGCGRIHSKESPLIPTSMAFLILTACLLLIGLRRPRTAQCATPSLKSLN